MLERRPRAELSRAELPWLRAKHYFAIDLAGNPALNNDEIAGNSGFPFHGYRNIEIDTYVMAWWPMRMISVRRRLEPGDLQVMNTVPAWHSRSGR
jgi:redox-sensitive bicupin YhaK (pirin superfamily)